MEYYFLGRTSGRIDTRDLGGRFIFLNILYKMSFSSLVINFYHLSTWCSVEITWSRCVFQHLGLLFGGDSAGTVDNAVGGASGLLPSGEASTRGRTASWLPLLPPWWAATYSLPHLRDICVSPPYKVSPVWRRQRGPPPASPTPNPDSTFSCSTEFSVWSRALAQPSGSPSSDLSPVRTRWVE